MFLTVWVCLCVLEREREREREEGGLLKFNSHFSICRQASERGHLSQTCISCKYTLVQLRRYTHIYLTDPCLCTCGNIFKYAYAVQGMMVCAKAEYHPVRAQPLSAIHHSGAANDTNTYTGRERARGAGQKCVKKEKNEDRDRGRAEGAREEAAGIKRDKEQQEPCCCYSTGGDFIYKSLSCQ